jgi:microcystin-dependent protein
LIIELKFRKNLESSLGMLLDIQNSTTHFSFLGASFLFQGLLGFQLENTK